MKKLSGVTDPYRNILAPSLWKSDGSLHSGIKSALIKYVQKTLGHPISIFAVVNVIGSTLTYQYTESSDIDLSLGLRPEYDHLLPELHEKCKNAVDTFILPGTQHPVNLFVSPSVRKLRPESLTGGYDLLSNKWIKIPSKPTESDLRYLDMFRPFLNLQRNELKRQLAQLTRRPSNPGEAQDVADFFGRIDRERKWAYDFPTPAGGNRSTQNIAFKYSLKNQKYSLIDKLYNILSKKKFDN